jgi:hypothetical protein
MSFFGKLAFWKRDPPIDLNAGLDTNFDPAPSPYGAPGGFGSPQGDFGSPHFDTPQQDAFGTPQPYGRQGFEQPRIISETPNPYAQGNPSIQRDTYDKNLEIVSMKLDNLKVALENINQRLMNIERIAMDSQQEPQRRKPNW